MAAPLHLLLVVLLAALNVRVTHGATSICSVCYSEPCPFTPTLSLLYCSQVGTPVCGPCSANCTQCQSLNATNFTCTCNGTTAPTAQPTPAPTVSAAPTAPNTTFQPTTAPTQAPTVFSQCQFCGGGSPPTSVACNGSSLLLMYCETPVPATCVPCPVFCSFCYPPLNPTPFYTCTCPPTLAPTSAPTRAPTGTVAPTNAPTPAPTGPPINFETPLVTVILIALALAGCVLLTACCIIVLPQTAAFNGRGFDQPSRTSPAIVGYNQQVPMTEMRSGGVHTPQESQHMAMQRRVAKMF
jgi:hypothetical protein